MSGRTPETLDVSQLPTFGFGTRSPMWWGTLGLIAIEGMVFALAIMSYFYLRGQAPSWPDGGPAPDLLWGTINTVLMLASGLPNWWTKRAAERLDLRQVRLGMIVCVLFALAMLVLRWVEFGALNVRWDTSAYGSIVWMLIGLHTTHLLTDAYDTIVLTVLLHTVPVEGKRYADASENAAYWYFVLASWLAVYAVVYWGARF